MYLIDQIYIIAMLICIDQVMVGLLVVFFSAIAHARYLPFNNSKLNLFEFLSLFTSSMTFFLGVFTVEAGSRYISPYHVVPFNFGVLSCIKHTI